MALTSGTRLGPYEIVAPLGSGGMGEVYRARDTRLGRDVAIKVLPQDTAATPADRARFAREAKTISSINHPNICVLHDIGTEGDTDYLVMELVEGETLARRIARGPLPTSDVLRIGAQIADALDRAHRAGVVHRDLKPSNVMLATSGAKLMDFGLARGIRGPVADPTDATATAPEGGAPPTEEPITKTGTVVGTYQYMAPEQLEGKRTDARSDLWALGCVLYEMATGKRAFEGPTAASIISAIMRDQPREMAELSPLTPPALEQLVRGCLAKDPEVRIQTGHDVKLQLVWIMESGVRPVAPRNRGWASPMWGITAVATVLVFVAGALVWNSWSKQSRQQTASSGFTKVPILVSEFEGPSADPNLTTAARQLVMANFDQSGRFESVSLVALRMALESAGKSDSTRVGAPLGRELAFRNGIKVVVEGRIDRIGTSFSILLTARDVESGRVLHSVTGSAHKEEALIKTLADLTSDLRGRMGEQPDSLVTDRIRWHASTPSFEAYRKYAEAFDLQQMRGDDRGSIRLLDDALRIDPDFAEAWALKHFAYGHLGDSDSAVFALRQALMRPHRLSEEGRMFLQGLQDALEGDFASADAKYRELIRRGYQLSSSFGNHGWILTSAGRYEEALEAYRRAAHINPIGPQQWVLSGEISLLLLFGHLGEARREAVQLRGTYADPWLLGIEVAAGDWKRADSLAGAILRDPIRSVTAGYGARHVEMATSASRGSLEQVWKSFDAARVRVQAKQDLELLSKILERQALLAIATESKGRLPKFRLTDDRSAYGLTIRGIIAALGGDVARTKEAMRLADESARQQARAPIRDNPLDILAACALGVEGKWSDSARALAKGARREEGPDEMPSPILTRWLAARAFERCNLPDSAAAYYELALDPTHLWWTRAIESKAVSSFAHARLARLYRGLGRETEARWHREILAANFTSPDSEYRHLLVP